MKKSLYTVLDQKAESIGTVWVAVSDSEAERAVSASVSDNSLIRRYPADFALMRLGDIDMGNGQIIACAVPVLVAKLDMLLADE